MKLSYKWLYTMASEALLELDIKIGASNPFIPAFMPPGPPGCAR